MLRSPRSGERGENFQKQLHCGYLMIVWPFFLLVAAFDENLSVLVGFDLIAKLAALHMLKPVPKCKSRRKEHDGDG